MVWRQAIADHQPQQDDDRARHRRFVGNPPSRRRVINAEKPRRLDQRQIEAFDRLPVFVAIHALSFSVTRTILNATTSTASIRQSPQLTTGAGLI
jgi:hypothetical protein